MSCPISYFLFQSSSGSTSDPSSPMFKTSPTAKLVNFTFGQLSSPTKCTSPRSPIGKVSFGKSIFSNGSKGSSSDLLKYGAGDAANIENINTGGCGVDPSSRVNGQKCKRSRSLIRRSSKKSKDQIQVKRNPDDCIIC